MNKRKRVAVYIREPAHDDISVTFNPLAVHYVGLVTKHPDWELLHIYFDHETAESCGPALNELMKDARSGKFDLVITKSMSRLSKDLNESFKYLLDLSSLTPPVEVIFEDEDISTFNKDNEIYLSIR